MFGLVPRLFQDLRYSMRRALLVYFHSRVWHTICYSPKMVNFTAQECDENEERKGADGFLRGFKRGVFRASQTYRETLHGKSYAFTG